MNKQENIYSLKGFDKVFRFTFRQTFKNKAYITSFVMFVLVMTFMSPIQYASFRAGSSAAGEAVDYSPEKAGIDNLYVLNETDIPFEKSDIEWIDVASDDAAKTQISIEQKPENEITASLGQKDAALIINYSDTGYAVNIVASDDTELAVSDLDGMSSYAAERFDEARLAATGLNDDNIAMLQNGIDGLGVYDEQEYLKEGQKTVSQRTFFDYLIGYSIILMIVMVMSTSYIITSVNEEKQSKLVESILVSVRPMALLLGKITGMMAYVVMIIICGMIGSGISNAVLENVFEASAHGFVSSGFSFAIFTENGPLASVVLIMSIILGFLAFGLLAGLFGSACNQQEDVQGATSSVMMICMLGYFVAIGAGTSDNSTFSLVGSIIPPLSYYLAPVAYITGRIPAYILIISMVIQIAVVVVLAVLSAKTYRNLLLSDTGKPKFATILKALK